MPPNVYALSSFTINLLDSTACFIAASLTCLSPASPASFETEHDVAKSTEIMENINNNLFIAVNFYTDCNSKFMPLRNRKLLILQEREVIIQVLFREFCTVS